MPPAAPSIWVSPFPALLPGSPSIASVSCLLDGDGDAVLLTARPRSVALRDILGDVRLREDPGLTPGCQGNPKDTMHAGTTQADFGQVGFLGLREPRNALITPQRPWKPRAFATDKLQRGVTSANCERKVQYSPTT